MRMRHKRKNYRWLSLSVLAGLAMAVVLDVFAIRQVWQHYEEKMMIVGTVLAVEEPDREEVFFSILKGEEIGRDKAEESLALLQKYGYTDENGNIYNRKAREETWRIVGISGAVYAIYLLVLYLIWKEQERNLLQSIHNMSYMLGQFGKHHYQTADIPEDVSLSEIQELLWELGESLDFQQEQMKQEKEETKALVTDISHQLKTPIAALKACFEILQQEGLTPQEKQEFSERCSRQLCGLENLLEALLNISRMESGMIQVKKQQGDILETLASAVSRIYLKAESKRISIEVEETEDECWVISHDAKWTAEAFINLLENAVKYSPRESRIRIRMSKRTTFLRIEIEDEGIGVPKQEYHKIFKRFYRGQSDEVKQEEGSGVGLYLTREILERQGGSITVSAASLEKQVGTVFVVQIPYE